MAASPCYCCVCGLRQDEKSICQGILFFRAPNIISNMWLGEWITLRFTQQLIDLNDALGEEIQCEEIYCSRHFEDSCFKGSRLVKNSVPSRFLHPSHISRFSLSMERNKTLFVDEDAQRNQDDSAICLNDSNESCLSFNELQDLSTVNDQPYTPKLDTAERKLEINEVRKVTEMLPVSVIECSSPFDLTLQLPSPKFQMEEENMSLLVSSIGKHLNFLDRRTPQLRREITNSVDITNETKHLICLESEGVSKEWAIVPFGSSNVPFAVMDASELISPEEPYFEDYEVPNSNRSITTRRRLKVDCWKRFCQMGCICDSLSLAKSTYKRHHQSKRKHKRLREDSEYLKYPRRLLCPNTLPEPPHSRACDSDAETERYVTEEEDSESSLETGSPVLSSRKPRKKRRQHSSQPRSTESHSENAQESTFDIQTFYVEHVLAKENELIKKECEIYKEKSLYLENQIKDKLSEIEELKKNLSEEKAAGKSATMEMTLCFPRLVEEAKNYLDLLAGLKANVVKPDLAAPDVNTTTTKEEQKAPFVENTKSNTVTVAKDEDKGKEAMLVEDGVYKDFYPFTEEVLDKLAIDNTATIFIRQLMRKMFTFDFLSTKTLRGLKEEHLNAIIVASMKRFKVYRRQNGQQYHLTADVVKTIISSEFSCRHAEKKKKDMLKEYKG